MKNRHSFIVVLFLLFAFHPTFSQDNTLSTPAAPVVKAGDDNLETRKIYKRKGTLYYYWGYNRAAYTHSDVHFHGKGYDFTITDIAASDEPGYPVNTYYDPGLFTCPQYNQRFGYFLSDKLFITIGHDHMKYRADKQTTHLTGTIKDGPHAGTYNNTDILIGETSESGQVLSSVVNTLPHGIVTDFQHCDGLNDISAEIGHLEQLWISKNAKYALSALGSVGLGVDVLDTDAEILGLAPKHDAPSKFKPFHPGGYSFSGSVGVQFDVYNHFFILGKIKSGFINLPDINTTVEGGKANQQFMFLESMMVVGYYHVIGKKK
ncbi:MAG: hypothetical protein ACHQRM_00620 [Bacteroidia bacterium]